MQTNNYPNLQIVEVSNNPDMFVKEWKDLMLELHCGIEESEQTAYKQGSKRNDPRIGDKSKKWLMQFMK
jgi:hypothetical protein